MVDAKLLKASLFILESEEKRAPNIATCGIKVFHVNWPLRSVPEPLLFQLADTCSHD